jgi:hypothetical protein
LIVSDITWHVYECPPVDFWNGAVGVEEYLVLLGQRGVEVEEIEVFVGLFEGAVNAVANRTLWEGDGAWWLSALPDVESRMMWVMFLAKQQNNGMTFVASMVELPWLDEWRRDQPRAVPLAQSRRAVYVDRARTLAKEVIAQRPQGN